MIIPFNVLTKNDVSLLIDILNCHIVLSNGITNIIESDEIKYIEKTLKNSFLVSFEQCYQIVSVLVLNIYTADSMYEGLYYFNILDAKRLLLKILKLHESILNKNISKIDTQLLSYCVEIVSKIDGELLSPLDYLFLDTINRQIEKK